MPTTQNIVIDLNTRGANPVAFTHQGDTARSFVFEVYNNGETFSLTGYTAKIAAMLPADKGYHVIAGENMATGTISDNTITATLPAEFSAKPGNGVLTIILTGSGASIRPINVDFRIQKSADAPETIAGASDFVPILEQYIAEDMATYINAWLDEHPDAAAYYITGSKLVVDSNGILSLETDTDEIVEALDLGTLRSDVDDLKSDLQSLEGGGLSNEAKTVLLRCFQNVAWINDDGQTYYDALEDALYPPANLVSISAVFNQGSAVIYDTDSLDTLRQYLTVTAYYDDSSTGVVTTYTLSGTLTVGTSTITVSYGGKTTTSNVVVTRYGALPAEYQEVEYITGSGNAYIDTGVLLSGSHSLKTTARFNSATQGSSNFLGVSDDLSGAAKTFGLISFGSAGKIGFFLFGGSVQAIQYDNQFHEYEISASRCAVDGTKYDLSGVVNTSVVLTRSLWLFAFRQSSNTYYTPMSLGRTEIDDGSAKKTFVPCYRKADGVIGMFELTSATFHTNDGEGSFMKGGDVA